MMKIGNDQRVFRTNFEIKIMDMHFSVSDNTEKSDKD